jgi:hypothetical protein
MNGGFGIDILKNEAVLVFIRNFGGPFMRRYLAKFAPKHSHHSFLVSIKQELFYCEGEHNTVVSSQ